MPRRRNVLTKLRPAVDLAALRAATELPCRCGAACAPLKEPLFDNFKGSHQAEVDYVWVESADLLAYFVQIAEVGERHRHDDFAADEMCRLNPKRGECSPERHILIVIG